MFGFDDLTCDAGEEWDWNAMACVTAGQAVTPTPPLPPPSQMPIPSLPPAPMPAPTPAPAPPTFFEKYKTPILVVGAIVVAGTLAYWVSDSGGSRATPNVAGTLKRWRKKGRKKAKRGHVKVGTRSVRI